MTVSTYRSHRLVFHEDPHSYELDGVQVPSVTQVIRSCYPVSPYVRRYGREAMERGTLIHRLIELDAGKNLDESSVDDSLRGYLEGWRMFRYDIGARVIRSEFIVAHIRGPFSFAGRVDIYARCRGKRIIVDIKSGAVPEWVGLQLSAYCLAARSWGMHPQRAAVLTLRENGTYRFWEMPPRDGEFLSILHAFFHERSTKWMIA